MSIATLVQTVTLKRLTMSFPSKGARVGISSATSAAATGVDDVLGGADSIHRKETTASRYANGARYTVRGKTRTSFPRLPGWSLWDSPYPRCSLCLCLYLHRNRNCSRRLSCSTHKQRMVCGNLYL